MTPPPSGDPREHAAPAPQSALLSLFTITQLALLLLLAIVGSGLLALREIPKERWPAVDVPLGVVTAIYPGASPELVEEEVTAVLERAFLGLPERTRLESTSMESVALVLVEFDVNADADEALNATAEALDGVRDDLPDAVKDVQLIRVSTSSDPIFVFSLVAQDMPLAQRRALALDLRDRLESVPGVDEVDVVGLQAEQVQVLVDRQGLEEIGGTLSDVTRAVQNAQMTIPLGRVEPGRRSFPLDVDRIGLDLDALGALSVRAHSTGSTVPLRSVATLQRVPADPTESTRLVRRMPDGSTQAGESLSFQVTRQPGGNVPVVVADVKAELARFEATLPPGVTLVVTTDRSSEIWEGINLLLVNGYQAVLLVFVLRFLFIGTRESIVAGLSIPLTFLATFAVLQLMGQSLNNLSLMALVIALGLLVDNFILVMEGMHEYLHAGKRPVDAAIATIKTYALPSLSGVLTTIGAFLPLALLGGLEGRFVQVIPLTICICLLISYSISITLDTSLGAVVLRKQEANPVTAWVQRGLGRLESWYDRVVVPAALGTRRRRWVVLTCTLVTKVGAFGLATQIDSILYPATDEAQIGATLTLPPGAALAEAERLAARVEETLSGDPDIDVFTVSAGRRSSLAASGTSVLTEPDQAEYLVGVTLQLIAADQRTRPSYELADDYRQRLSLLSEGALEMHQIRMGAGSGAPIEVELRADGVDQVDALTDEVVALLDDVPGIDNLRDSRQPHRGAWELQLSDEALRFHGLDRQQVLGFLRSAISGETAVTLYEGREQVDIVVGYDWGADRGWGAPTSLDEVLAAGVPDFFGRTTPLSALGTAVLKTSPISIAHEAGKASVVLSADPAPGASSVEVAAEIERRLEGLVRRSGDEVVMAGDYASFQETQVELARALVLAAALIFSILVLQFRSFVQPLIIFSTMPMALIGVFVGFFMTDLELSFPAMLGIVALVGIVVNDAIVLIDTINVNVREGGMSALAAVRAAGVARMRPILLTSLTTVIGLLPLAFTDKVWEGLCMSIVYGISLATVLTLVVIPALYLEFARAGDLDNAPGEALPPEAEGPPSAPRLRGA